ncbi:Myosin-2 [Toxocara canis]|uniref:Myosin-2 n=1 Tax=Toxocara canis TaxID=6265 RepID=A0A0B2UQU9_TOXCA|nr:Myosin-2 [Toxocara canis]
MPIVRENKREEILENLRATVNDFNEKLLVKQKQRSDLETELNSIINETEKIIEEIKCSKSGNVEVEEQMARMVDEQTKIEKELLDVNEKLQKEEQRTSAETETVNKLQQQLDLMRTSIQEAEVGKRKMNVEKTAKDNQIHSLSAEVNLQQQTIAKLNKERKQQNELAERITNQLTAIEQRNRQTATVKAKLMDDMHEAEQQLQKEKSATVDANKERRKIEGELKIAEEIVDELRKQKEDIWNGIKTKDATIRDANNRLEDQQRLSVRISKQLQDGETKMKEIEEEIRNVHEARTNSENVCKQKQLELDEMCSRTEEQTVATNTQIEQGKKFESEIANLRRQLQQSEIIHVSALTSLRKKTDDTLNEFKDQINMIESVIDKNEKQNAQLRTKIIATNSELDKVRKTKMEFERTIKSLNQKIFELQTESNEQLHEIESFEAMKRQIITENNELKSRQKELQQHIATISSTKTQLVAQLKETNRIRNEETGERQRIASNVRNLQAEVAQLRSTLDDEIRSNEESRRKLNATENELQQWRDRLSDKTRIPAEAIDEIKKKQALVINNLEKELNEANLKINDLERRKLKMSDEAEAAKKEVERCLTHIAQLEKKMNIFNDTVIEWKRKVDKASEELNEAQNNSRNFATDLYQEQSINDKLISDIQCIQQENNALREELKELNEQLDEGTKTIDETRKLIRRFETHKEDLQRALDEAEAAIEVEEGKYERSQNEISKIRDETQRSLVEKDEQFENAKAAQQRAVETIQV